MTVVCSDEANGCAFFQFLFLSEVLQWRAQTTPDHVLYTLLNCRVSSRHANLALAPGGFLFLPLSPFASVSCVVLLIYVCLFT